MSPDQSVNSLPDDLRLVPAAVVRRDMHIPETTLWRLGKAGILPAVRIGRRRFYRLSDLRQFIDEAIKAPPAKVPWGKSDKHSAGS